MPTCAFAASASYEAAKKGVVLTFTIDEGPQYRFGKVDIQSQHEGHRRSGAAVRICARNRATPTTPMR